MDVKQYISNWADRYKTALTENIMPFWLKNGLDRENGGVYTCLNRDGSLMDTTKSVWFQGRFAFTCAYAYNNVEKRQEWLDAAKTTLDFIEKHCFDDDGHMYFSVTADGRPLRKRRYVFSETFAAIAMSEYALATGDKAYAEKAMRVFNDIQRFLSTPGYLTPKFEAGVELQGHSIIMILINVASRLRTVCDDPKLTAQIDDSIGKLRRYFIHPEFKCLLETVGPNGEF
ncbi:MAG: AGE family epimerase/isomerase, partial [Prevotella sp.]|nr:AGE family epimerase/isomerase [Prevotella sp.]